ncbi:MAG: tetratricopeptide repeat protein [Actinomycetota bacterium]
MTWIIFVCAALLSGIAAAGVLWPFGGSRQVALERLVDPLEDQRLSLMRALRDLDEERTRGELAEDAYRRIRGETETRTIAVLRALEARDRAGELGASLKTVRRVAAWNGEGRPEEKRKQHAPTLIAALVSAAIVAGVVTVLAGAVRDRDPGRPFTGGVPEAPPGAVDPLSFFEQRVLEHPRDLAARLDLAQRYMDSGDARAAIEQYVVALEIEPRSAEARASLGFLLYLAGRADEGLSSVERALEVDPDYPEGLYFKGVILMRGLDRPAAAAAAFREYLEAAPFGSRRAEVEGLLREAEAGTG